MSSFSGGDDEPSAAEWAVMALSAAVTLSLFAFVAWHAATTPAGGPPEATVIGTEPAGDRLVLTVEVHNPKTIGLESVTVSVECANEALRFTHVPTNARRTGTVVCPATATDPSAAVQNWIEA